MKELPIADLDAVCGGRRSEQVGIVSPVLANPHVQTLSTFGEVDILIDRAGRYIRVPGAIAP